MITTSGLPSPLTSPKASLSGEGTESPPPKTRGANVPAPSLSCTATAPTSVRVLTTSGLPSRFRSTAAVAPMARGGVASGCALANGRRTYSKAAALVVLSYESVSVRSTAMERSRVSRGGGTKVRVVKPRTMGAVGTGTPFTLTTVSGSMPRPVTVIPGLPLLKTRVGAMLSTVRVQQSGCWAK